MRSSRLAGLFIVLMLAGSAVGILVPAGLGWDFANFYDAGRRVLSGQAGDLYHPTREIAGTPPQGVLGFFGAPVSALFYAPLGWFSANTALILFKLENVAALGSAFALLLTYHRRFLPQDEASQARFTAVFLGLCLVYQPFWTVFRVGGQTTPTVFLLFTIAVILHTRSLFWGSATCLMAASLIKPALAPAFAFLAIVSGVSFFWRAASVAAVTGVISLAILGIPVHMDFVTLMRESGALTYRWYYNSSLFILIDAFNNSPETAGQIPLGFRIATAALQAGLAAVVFWLWMSARRLNWNAAARLHFNVMLAIFLFLLCSRTVWEHYLQLLFIPLIYVVARRQQFPPRALAIVGSIFVLSIFQNLIFTMWLREQASAASPMVLLAIALLKSAPLSLTLIFLMKYREALFSSYATDAWGRSS